MNHLMLQCLALFAVVMVTSAAPTALSSKFQKDKARLTNLIREVGNSIDTLELDIEVAAKREIEEPIVEAEISEDDTQANIEEARGSHDNNLENIDLVEKGKKKKKPRPSPEFNSDIDFDAEEKEEVDDNSRSSLNEVLRMLLNLERSRKSSTDNADDNHAAK